MIADVKSLVQRNLHNVQIQLVFFPFRFSLSISSISMKRIKEERKGEGRKKLLLENDGASDAANRLNSNCQTLY